MRHRVSTALALLALLAPLARAEKPAPARAEKPAATDGGARHHFDEGTKHYHLGEFKEAAEEYKAAYKAKPDPVFLYNIAQAYRLANEFQQALFFYRSYLTSAQNAPNRAEIEERIRKLESQLAQQKALSTAPPTETVLPGSEPRPGSPVEPRASTPPPVELHTGMLAQPPPRETSLGEVRREPRERTPIYKKWWLWTIVGVVVVGAVVGIAVGVSSSGTTGAPSSHFGTISF